VVVIRTSQRVISGLLDEDDVDHHEDGRDGEDRKEKRADVVEGHKDSLEMLKVDCSRNEKDHAL
jgi:hypothetical protein